MVEDLMMAMFAERVDAGRRLGSRLRECSAQELGGQDLVVLGLPRGGVPVAFEVALALDAPLDVIVVRKLGVPFQPELGMGAIGEDGVRVINDDIVDRAGVAPAEIRAVEARERVELLRRAERFRGRRGRISLRGRVAVIVDDGIATGSTAKAACQVARAHGARRVVLAVPVAPVDWRERIGTDADLCVSLATPEPFYGVGQFYAAFTQTTDAEVVSCLERAAARWRRVEPGLRAFDDDVEIPIDHQRLSGHLVLPPRRDVGRPPAIVVFAHGSGSSRHSPRNRYVASVLQSAGLGTLLFDLLTPSEELDRSNVFDVESLGRRLTSVTEWVRARDGLSGASIGYFGASTGAAAALWAAADPTARIGAVVSRGGRPDLAAQRLHEVRCPTLLIVGGNDDVVIRLNEEAFAQLRGERSLQIVRGASHLFEEPGTLEAASNLARDWFVVHLRADHPSSP